MRCFLVILLLILPVSGHANDWRTIQAAPFQIYFEPNVISQDIEQTITILQTARQRIKTDWDWQPQTSLEVRIYGHTWRFMEATGQPWWFGGIFQDQVLHLQNPALLNRKGILADILTHEYMHALISQQTDACPRWFNEGLAVYVSRVDVDPRSTPSDSLPTPNELDRIFAQPSDMKQLHRAYDASLAYVLPLIRQFGAKTVGEFVAALAEDKDFAVEFQSHFGMSLDRYIQSVQKKRSE